MFNLSGTIWAIKVFKIGIKKLGGGETWSMYVLSYQVHFYVNSQLLNSFKICQIYAQKYADNPKISPIIIPGLSPINKNLSSEKFFDKSWKILNQQIFSENLRNFQLKNFGAAGWTDFWKFSSEYSVWNTFWKYMEIFRILRILSEFWEFLLLKGLSSERTGTPHQRPWKLTVNFDPQTHASKN